MSMDKSDIEELNVTRVCPELPVTSQDLKGSLSHVLQEHHDNLAHRIGEMLLVHTRRIEYAIALQSDSHTRSTVPKASVNTDQLELEKVERVALMPQAEEESCNETFNLPGSPHEWVRQKTNEAEETDETNGKASPRMKAPVNQRRNSLKSANSVHTLEQGIELMRSYKAQTKLIGPTPVMQSCALLVKSSYFECLSIAFVMLNAVFVGLQVDWSAQHLGEDLPVAFTICDFCFTAVFALELLLRILAAGWWFYSCLNGDVNWNVFDTFLVVVSVLEAPIVLAMGSSVDLAAARLLRVMRLVRILRMVRLFKFFKQLRVVVQTVLAALKPLGWALILLFIFIYLSSVMVLQFIGDDHENSSRADLVHHHYGSLLRTQYTLFMCITNGISWVNVAEPLLDISSWFAVFFIFYTSFCLFCIVNIVTGIFVENAKAMTELDDEMMILEEAANREKWLKEVKMLFNLADSDGSGDLTVDEFVNRLEDFRIQVLLKNLGIDILSMNPRGLFNTLDFNNSGTVTIDEFADGLIRFRGFARSLDLAEVRHFLVKIMSWAEQIQSSCDKLAVKHTSIPVPPSPPKPLHVAPLLPQPTLPHQVLSGESEM